MATTLQTLIDQSADYIKVDLNDDEDGTLIETRLISAINEAKNIIAKKYYPMITTENIPLDAYSSFITYGTSKTFCRLIKVTYNGSEIQTEQYASTVYCDAPANAMVAVEYQYIPADITNVTDAYPFPDVVDYRILCYRAAQTYYEIKGTTSSVRKAAVWEKKFKDALNSRVAADEITVIKDVYKI